MKAIIGAILLLATLMPVSSATATEHPERWCHHYDWAGDTPHFYPCCDGIWFDSWLARGCVEFGSRPTEVTPS